MYATENIGNVRVGIATLNPAFEFHVQGTSYATGNMFVDGQVGFGVGYGSLARAPTAMLNVVGTSYFSSNVGIATTTPRYTLEVAGTCYVSANVCTNGSVGVGTTSPVQPLHVVGNAYVSGNMGIGLTTPSYTLDVAGTGQFLTNLIVGGSMFGSGSTNITGISFISTRDLTVTNMIHGSVDGSSAYVINATQSNIQSLPNTWTIGAGATGVAGTGMAKLTLGATNTAVTVPGNIVVGSSTMTVANTSNSSLYVAGTSIFSSNVNINGKLFTFGNIGSISDKTIKTDLIQISSPLDKIAMLTGYTYRRIDGGRNIGDGDGTRECGLIAQDVQKVLPEVVSANENYNNLLTIAYGNMAGLFVEAFKEMRSEIQGLRAEVQDLQRQLSLQ